MNITKEQADKVIAALEIAKATLIEYGDWWPVGEPIAIVDCAEALTIMRGLAEDAELLALFAASQKQLPLNAAISATSPQVAQTEAALCEMVRLSEDAGLYDSDFQTGRAGSKP